MSKGNTAAPAAPTLSDWIDPFEQALRIGVQQFVQELLEAEVSDALGRLCYARCEPRLHFSILTKRQLALALQPLPQVLAPLDPAGNCRHRHDLFDDPLLPRAVV